MAIKESAKKEIRASAKKKVYNLRRKKSIKTVEKQIEKLLLENKAEEARKLLPTAYKAIDKALKMKTLKKNTAARNKSRLSRSIKRVATK